MKGYYFINTDVMNRRAHTAQILNTVSELKKHIDIELVAPRYSDFRIEDLEKAYDLPRMPKVNLLWSFHLSPGILSFILFNIPATTFLLRHKADFIYIRSNHFFPLGWIACLKGVPYFYETHRVPLSPTEKIRDTLMSKYARGLVLISKHVESYYKKFNRHTMVAHDAVSMKLFGEARNINDEKIVVYTGTISKLKGIDTLLETARLMPDTKFTLAGILHPEFKNINWPENVIYMGHLEQVELPKILSAASVLVLPHPANEYSQSPMKLFEYMASGVPIVSSRLPSLEEVLNENNSVLVEPESATALREGIEKGLSPESRKLGDQAKEDVLEYTWEKRGEKIAHFIKKCRD